MRPSIRIRLILAMNLLVVGVGVAVGWAGVAVSGRVIEQRLVDESAQNAAGIFHSMRLPMSDLMMRQLRQILGSETAAGPADALEIAATSLPEAEARDLRALVARGPLARRVTLAARAYLVGAADVPARLPASADRPGMRLYVLVPEAQVDAAKQASERTLTWVTVGAIVVATLLASWLSATILRPIRRLATRMDRLSEQAAEEGFSGPADAAGGARAPREIAQLSTAFDRLLARLEEARRKLARSARLATLGQVAASVAHELRNPLSGIKMNARVLADELAKAGSSDSGLDRIIREADRMDLYLGELLGLAAGTGPEPPLDRSAFRPLRLAEVGESVLALVERRCQHGGVTLRRQWEAAAPPVRADENQVRQIMLNLVLNALDAMPAGGTLTVSTATGAGAATDSGTTGKSCHSERSEESRRTTGAGAAVRFSVADTGRGVQVPEGTDIFEPFVTTKTGGVGLGLYVCRRNVERHGGRMGYESSGAGATFWFELPAAGAAETARV
jgi:signal transduction histidine kinase